MTDIESVFAPDGHTLRLVELLHAETGRAVWLSVANIKAIRERTVDPEIASQMPEDAEVAETFITMRGEAAGMIVQGRPVDVLTKIRDHSVYL